ncbi:MAG: aspartate kinase [Sphingobacteriia bacterium]|nr:aspartate kinase [Sphingobacteriia bacterium]
MALIVQKFGGTSVGSIERIKASAKLVEKEILKGNSVIVVVSAMAGTTDHLINLTKEITKTPYGSGLAEYDSIISSGEQVSAGLFVLALQSMGLSARSWQGWQIPIYTNKVHSKAFIEKIATKNILDSLSRGEIAVVTGFQGITKDNKITTLGRGGSDTTAVAIASAFKAQRCDIYTDVDGVYSTDPRMVKSAKKLENVDYDEMLELASLGAKVLHTRSTAIAKRHDVNLNIVSSFEEKKGTKILHEELNSEKLIENYNVTGIALSQNEVRFIIKKSKLDTKELAKIIAPLTSSQIGIDMIINTNESIEFNVLKTEADITKKLLLSTGFLIENHININENISKISLVGIGIKSNLMVLQKLYEVMSEKTIEIIALISSEIKISFLINKEYSELAVQSLHNAFID